MITLAQNRVNHLFSAKIANAKLHHQQPEINMRYGIWVEKWTAGGGYYAGWYTTFAIDREFVLDFDTLEDADYTAKRWEQAHHNPTESPTYKYSARKLPNGLI